MKIFISTSADANSPAAQVMKQKRFIEAIKKTLKVATTGMSIEQGFMFAHQLSAKLPTGELVTGVQCVAIAKLLKVENDCVWTKADGGNLFICCEI